MMQDRSVWVLERDRRVEQLRQAVARFGYELAILFGSGARGDVHEGSDLDVPGHSLVALVDSLASELEVQHPRPLAADLDLHHVPARYPDGLPDLAPFEAYTREQAEHAVTAAAELMHAPHARTSG
jgi:hypothetical protein